MIYTNSDGGSHGNPGPGAIGVIIRREGGILSKYSEFLGERVTNNEAEYWGLIRALELARKITRDDLTCILDSELVVKQLLGEYAVKHLKLKKLFLKVQELQEHFKTVRYLHVSRWNSFQRLADELLNEELNKRGYWKSKQKTKR